MKHRQSSSEYRVVLLLSFALSTGNSQGTGPKTSVAANSGQHRRFSLASIHLARAAAAADHHANLAARKIAPVEKRTAPEHRETTESSFWFSPKKPLQHGWGPVLLQRTGVHLRRRGPVEKTYNEPQNVEDVDHIYGVPKIVWVILADVLAMAVFLGCIGIALKCTRSDKASERDEDQAQLDVSLAKSFGSHNQQPYNQTPTFMGKMPQVS